jgi:putative ABC transport system permease protein
MNVALLQGRAFLASDDARGEPVAIVNRTLANRYWPDASPIDRLVRTSAGFDSATWFRIVGVVDDVRHVSLSRDPVAEMYRPIAQTAMPIFSLVVRTDREPAALAPAARAAVQSLDPNLPIYDVRTMDERIAGSFAQARGTMLLLLVTAGLAAALSGVAVYGSIWYSVSQRIPEIGVRLALGASRASVFIPTRASVFGDVLRRAVSLTAVGALIGLGAALAGGRLIAGMLFETRAADPLTLAAVVGATMGLSLAAGVVPARRAMRVDPMTALRNE